MSDIDINKGNWIKDYDEYMLIKFTRKYEYQQDFLDGRLYFNTVDFFRKCDAKGQGDSNEGNNFIINNQDPKMISANLEKVNGQYMIVVRDYTNNPLEYKPGIIKSYSAADNRNRKIICFYTMYINFENKKVSPFPKNMGQEFGEYGVLILNRQEFFKRVEVALKKIKNCNDPQMGFVEYQEMAAGYNEWHTFKKEKKLFDYQNEFRITFKNENEKPYILDLECTLRDIAVPIVAEDVGQIYVEKQSIVYPIRRNISDE